MKAVFGLGRLFLLLLRAEALRKTVVGSPILQIVFEVLMTRGLEAMLMHAAQFIEQRLAPSQPRYDGKQTPWRGHPVFVAQHATTTCCRGCLAKWHRIERGRELTEEEKGYIVEVLGRWLASYTQTEPRHADP